MPYDYGLYFCRKCGEDLSYYADGLCPRCDRREEPKTADGADRGVKDPFVRTVEADYELGRCAWLSMLANPRQLYAGPSLHINTGAERLNDGTLDWVSRLQQTEEASFIEEKLMAVVKRGGCSGAVEACEVFAAAAVVADLNQSSIMDSAAAAGGVGGPHALQDLELLRLAAQAIRLAQRDAQLREIWDGSDHADECYRTVDQLEAWLKR